MKITSTHNSMYTIIVSILMVLSIFVNFGDAENTSFWPANCEEVLENNPNAFDGEHTLYINNDPQQAWSAYCQDMQGTPKEYLTLQNTCEGQNYSLYAAGGARQGSDVVTKFIKVRIDPETLEIINEDKSFAVSSGKVVWPSGSITSRKYGSAGDCVGIDSNLGSANIDLRGTPFKIKRSGGEQFLVSGYMAAGDIMYLHDDQVVNLTGGGYCGVNQAGTWPDPQNIKLEYIAP
ncbi:MAG: hypothetical protein HKP58_06975 [Desulfatitalea sp.]|nr:hypothetical protein [Desulfatitalea sp.]NNK00139.1 hypothetical protein [Desulfatitalea sp.]